MNFNEKSGEKTLSINEMERLADKSDLHVYCKNATSSILGWAQKCYIDHDSWAMSPDRKILGERFLISEKAFLRKIFAKLEA